MYLCKNDGKKEFEMLACHYMGMQEGTRRVNSVTRMERSVETRRGRCR